MKLTMLDIINAHSAPIHEDSTRIDCTRAFELAAAMPHDSATRTVDVEARRMEKARAERMRLVARRPAR
jgi:hypothetical protein